MMEDFEEGQADDEDEEELDEEERKERRENMLAEFRDVLEREEAEKPPARSRLSF